MPFKVTAALVRALKVSIEAQHAIKNDQDKLRAELIENFSALDPEAKALILGRLEEHLNIDIRTAVANNTAIETFTKSTVIPSFPLKTNKNFEIAKEVQKFLTPEIFLRLVAGQEIEGYSNLPCFPNISERPDSFWGTSKSTIYSASLLAAHKVVTGKTASDYIGYNFVYAAPTPAGLVLEETACHKGEMQIVYSGFAFGANRVPSLYESEAGAKVLHPYDGSSFVQEVTGLPSHYTFTTWDQIYYNMRADGHTSEAIATWSDTPTAVAMTSLYTPLKIENLTPGDILFFRNKISEGTPYGTSGNTFIVADFPRDGKVLTLGSNRDMPHIEGFVVKDFDLPSIEDSTKYVGLQRVNESADIEVGPKLLHLVGSEVEGIESLWSQMEAILSTPAASSESDAGGGGSEGAAAALGAPSTTFTDAE